MKEYIFFDLDGTLTDPAMGIITSIEYAATKMGLDYEREALKCFIGPPLLDTFRSFFNLSIEEGERAVSLYRERYSVKGLFENMLYPGIENALKELKESGKKLVIATSKPEIYTKRITDHFGITKYFEFISGALLDHSRVEKGDVIRHALDTLGISGCDAVMIGDRKFDIEGAKENNMIGYGVLWGYGSLQEITDSGAEKIFESVEEMKNFLI